MASVLTAVFLFYFHTVENCEHVNILSTSVFFCLCSGGSLDLIKTYDDIEQFREMTGASSVMLARTAMWNPSIFRSQGTLSVDEVIEEYVKYVSTEP